MSKLRYKVSIEYLKEKHVGRCTMITNIKKIFFEMFMVPIITANDTKFLLNTNKMKSNQTKTKKNVDEILMSRYANKEHDCIKPHIL